MTRSGALISSVIVPGEVNAQPLSIATHLSCSYTSGTSPSLTTMATIVKSRSKLSTMVLVMSIVCSGCCVFTRPDPFHRDLEAILRSAKAEVAIGIVESYEDYCLRGVQQFFGTNGIPVRIEGLIVYDVLVPRPHFDSVRNLLTTNMPPPSLCFRPYTYYGPARVRR